MQPIQTLEKKLDPTLYHQFVQSIEAVNERVEGLHDAFFGCICSINPDLTKWLRAQKNNVYFSLFNLLLHMRYFHHLEPMFERSKIKPADYDIFMLMSKDYFAKAKESFQETVSIAYDLFKDKSEELKDEYEALGLNHFLVVLKRLNVISIKDLLAADDPLFLSSLSGGFVKALNAQASDELINKCTGFEHGLSDKPMQPQSKKWINYTKIAKKALANSGRLYRENWHFYQLHYVTLKNFYDLAYMVDVHDLHQEKPPCDATGEEMATELGFPHPNQCFIPLMSLLIDNAENDFDHGLHESLLEVHTAMEKTHIQNVCWNYSHCLLVKAAKKPNVQLNALSDIINFQFNIGVPIYAEYSFKLNSVSKHNKGLFVDKLRKKG